MPPGRRGCPTPLKPRAAVTRDDAAVETVLRRSDAVRHCVVGSAAPADIVALCVDNHAKVVSGAGDDQPHSAQARARIPRRWATTDLDPKWAENDYPGQRGAATFRGVAVPVPDVASHLTRARLASDDATSGAGAPILRGGRLSGCQPRASGTCAVRCRRTRSRSLPCAVILGGPRVGDRAPVRRPHRSSRSRWSRRRAGSAIRRPNITGPRAVRRHTWCSRMIDDCSFGRPANVVAVDGPICALVAAVHDCPSPPGRHRTRRRRRGTAVRTPRDRAFSPGRSSRGPDLTRCETTRGPRRRQGSPPDCIGRVHTDESDLLAVR